MNELVKSCQWLLFTYFEAESLTRAGQRGFI